MIDPTTIAAGGGILICAGLVVWGVRGIRKGMEAESTIEAQEARIAELEENARTHASPSATDDEYDRWLDTSDAD